MTDEDARLSRSMGKSSEVGGEAIAAFARLHGLTERQREIVARVVEGRSNEAIEGDLRIALPTVKNHLSSVFRKAGVESRYGIMHGVLSLGAASGSRDPPGRGADGPLDLPARGDGDPLRVRRPLPRRSPRPAARPPRLEPLEARAPGPRARRGRHPPLVAGRVAAHRAGARAQRVLREAASAEDSDPAHLASPLSRGLRSSMICAEAHRFLLKTYLPSRVTNTLSQAGNWDST